MNGSFPAYLGPRPLAPAFERALAEGTDAAWEAVCREVGPRVWAFPLLTPAACALLLAEIDRRVARRAAEGRDGGAPSSMHGYGVVLAELGMDDLLVDLRTRWLAPLAARHFADVGGDGVDGHHGFLAEYGAGADEWLGFHVDASAVTLNLCLGERFSGSEIYFRGLRCDLHRQDSARPDEKLELDHEVGTALLHAGRHRHGVHPIRSGRRRNLILWMQSGSTRDGACPCAPWCGSYSPP